MEHGSSGAHDTQRLFVGNLTSQISESELRSMLEKFGAVKYINLVKADATGISRGFAFVEMTDGDAIARVIAELDGKSIDGRRLKVRLGF